MRAYDYYVYQYTYRSLESVRRDTCGGLDSEFSHTETKQRTYLCVAPNDSLATALFHNRHDHLREIELVKTEYLGQLNDLLYLQ